MRQRLDAARWTHDLTMMRALAAEGFVDCFIQPLPLRPDLTSYISWASATDGFTETHLDTLRALGPALAAALDAIATRRGLASLMRTYLGRVAGQRVLDGAVTRGAGFEAPCAVSFADLRGFTALTEGSPPTVVLETLDRFFDLVGTAIRDHGGDIVKFIGDAILAVYPVGDGALADAARRAVAGARAALDALDALEAHNAAHARAIRVGFGIHAGDVFFGNVGTADRLDFTLVGSTVNRAVRVESMCKPLGVPLVVSEAVAEALGRADFCDLGLHTLVGVPDPQRLFTTPAHRPRAAGPRTGDPR